jgi:hypothetical protein
MFFKIGENLNIPKDKLLTLYILLMHVIEYYFNVKLDLVYNISNNAIYDQYFFDNLMSHPFVL